MDRFAADSYVYAKASGIYARSFVGKRTPRLFEAKRLRDLWTTLFNDEVPLVPEGLLTLYLERRAEQKAVDENYYTPFLVRHTGSFIESPSFLLRLQQSQGCGYRRYHRRERSSVHGGLEAIFNS